MIPGDPITFVEGKLLDTDKTSHYDGITWYEVRMFPSAVHILHCNSP